MPPSKLIFSIATVILTSTAQADVERISSNVPNLGQVGRIYLAPGLISQIEFPEPILEVKVGAPEKFQAPISSTNPAILNLYISDSRPFATNLIVNTTKRTFVFDLMPSLARHQDYVKIQGAVGGPSSSATLKRIAGGVIAPNNGRSAGKTISRGNIQ